MLQSKNVDDEDMENFVNNFMNQILINPLAQIAKLVNARESIMSRTLLHALRNALGLN